MNQSCREKLDLLKGILRDIGPCAVAYSGGVDSTLLATVANEVLGGTVTAIIASSPIFPQRETQQATAEARRRDIAYVPVESDELSLPEFRENPIDRCYYCKKLLFTQIREEAGARGFSTVIEGSNADDVRDYRPGAQALRELQIRSPLREAGLTKAEIRTISAEVYQLPTADKPAMACLASRVPYGSRITLEKLKQIEAMEVFLMDKGFVLCRARHHDTIVRIEVEPEQIPKLIEPAMRQACIETGRLLGFDYVAVDLEGYRTGSLNEALRRCDDRGPVG